MKQTRRRGISSPSHAWDALTLVIGDELQQELDKKLISAADLKEAIWLAETSGDKSSWTRATALRLAAWSSR